MEYVKERAVPRASGGAECFWERSEHDPLVSSVLEEVLHCGSASSPTTRSGQGNSPFLEAVPSASSGSKFRLVTSMAPASSSSLSASIECVMRSRLNLKPFSSVISAASLRRGTGYGLHAIHTSTAERGAWWNMPDRKWTQNTERDGLDWPVVPKVSCLMLGHLKAR